MRILLLTLLIGTLQAQTGEGALDSSESNWQNWTFAAVSIVTATAGIVVVSLDNGTAAH